MLTAADPTLRFNVTGGTADKSKYEWRALAGGGVNDYLQLRKINDANTVFTELLAISNAGAVTIPGSLLVGATSLFGSTFSAFQYAGATYNGLGIVSSDNSSGARFMLFAANSATCGSIDRVGTTSAVVYTATSDRRLKENIVDAPSAIEHINAVKVRSYNWIDGGHQVKYGVIAQEFFEVEPDAVVRGDDGETIEKTWAVDTSALVPAMIKALQELAADFQSYKNSHP